MPESAITLTFVLPEKHLRQGGVFLHNEHESKAMALVTIDL